MARPQFFVSWNVAPEPPDNKLYSSEQQHFGGTPQYDDYDAAFAAAVAAGDDQAVVVRALERFYADWRIDESAKLAPVLRVSWSVNLNVPDDTRKFPLVRSGSLDVPRTPRQ